MDIVSSLSPITSDASKRERAVGMHTKAGHCVRIMSMAIQS
ncbi:unnamed protein product [Periconia digitata]|uniref:Uncharacterized protein n=1 Tax=Periconia digitata TaxID=1303443 RepID=A0A9W4U6E6_9PLEO|nr:unnamed protein product [Periconia digitata]